MGINQLQGIEMMVQSSDTIDLVAASARKVQSPAWQA
jgi:hypothetical protein